MRPIEAGVRVPLFSCMRCQASMIMDDQCMTCLQEAAEEYRPEWLEVQVPQVAPGCIQLSSGRIARPTSKTAPSRASSAELSESFPSDGQYATHPLTLYCRDIVRAWRLTRCCFYARSALWTFPSSSAEPDSRLSPFVRS